MAGSIRVDLSELQEIMEALPDSSPAGEKRSHVLTRDDVMVIARIVQAVSHNTCAFGFTRDEVGTLKKFVTGVNRSILIVGYAILTALGAGLVTIVGWLIKTGIGELATKK